MRSRYGRTTTVEMFIVVAVFVFFGLITVGGIIEQRASSACLAAGYPERRSAFPFTQYCVKRVNQTDVVVPVSSITVPR